MSYFDHVRKKELEEVIEIKGTCWKCKELVEEKDLVTVTDGKTKWVELCRDCFDFYKDFKKFSKFGKSV
ncbi:hypothetical protein [Halobacillus sp. A5]|uniref:hypothetical protein n=1 Tax=Halobacillus sp. A5 TaxID=2880263 RepID=UPI0020A65B72|nr:hypothetical protein [Halobacillus sp. A5]MCP3027999.1 hypothetical protein [Halobacillus sp. A5]